jgi:EF-P beta-lysylation protein EpmB
METPTLSRKKESIITRRSAAEEPQRWQLELGEAFRRPADLLDYLGLENLWDKTMDRAAHDFPLRVPRTFASRMEKRNPADPLLRQVLPLGRELAPLPGYSDDPVGDSLALDGLGMVNKYRGRTLLIANSACAVNCRYCFRRAFPYRDNSFQRQQTDKLVTALRADPSIREIILSGGDPLMTPDDRLQDLLQMFRLHTHIRRLRIHTRLPVVLPNRVTDALILALKRWPSSVVMVLHINHAREIDDNVIQAAQKLSASGAKLFNQAVLLAGVNDSVDAQTALSEACFDAGVLPYYLHALDPVNGAAHFSVPDEQARKILAGVRRELPGYLVPKLVREQTGAPYKIPLE